MFQKKKINYYYSIPILIIGVSVTIFLLFILSFEREAFLQFILNKLNRPYLAEILNKKILAPEKFRLIKKACYLLIVFNFIVMYSLIYFQHKIVSAITSGTTSIIRAFISIINVFRNSNVKEKIILSFLFTTIICRCAYYNTKIDLLYDETWNYNYFTSRPFYINIFTFSSYPFFELSTHMFNMLPFSDKFNLRLFPMLSSTASVAVIFSCIKKLSGHFLTAIASAFPVAFMVFFTLNTVLAKGIMPEFLFATISLFALIFFLKNNHPRRYILIYRLSNILGIYLMPTHIYFFILQFLIGIVLMLLKEKQLISKFLMANAAIIFISFLLYLPIAMGSGLSFITLDGRNNENIYMPTPYILKYIETVDSYFTNGHFELSILILITIAVLLIRKKINSANTLLVVFGLSLYFLHNMIAYVQHINVPLRALGFVAITIPLFLYLLVSTLKDIVKPSIISFGILLIISVSAWLSHFDVNIKDRITEGNNTKLMAQLFIKHQIRSCYDNSPNSRFFMYYPGIEYYLNKQQLGLDIKMAAKKSLRYQPFDSDNKFDAIVDSLGADNTAYRDRYKMVFTLPAQGFNLWVIKK